jgi:hypothetical protein
LCPAVALGRHSAVALLLKAVLIQVSDYRLLGASGFSHAQTAIYDFKVKLFLKQGISHQLGRDAAVRFECENSAIDVTINDMFSPQYLFILV